MSVHRAFNETVDYEVTFDETEKSNKVAQTTTGRYSQIFALVQKISSDAAESTGKEFSEKEDTFKRLLCSDGPVTNRSKYARRAVLKCVARDVDKQLNDVYSKATFSLNPSNTAVNVASTSSTEVRHSPLHSSIFQDFSSEVNSDNDLPVDLEDRDFPCSDEDDDVSSYSSLKRANQKAKKAVDTSDINTTDASTSNFGGRPKRKRKRTQVYSSSDCISDDVSSQEEELKSSYIPPLKPPALTEVNIIEAPTLQLPVPSEGFQPSSVTIEQLSQGLVTETPRRMGTPSQSLGRPVALEEVHTSGLGVKALLRLNAEFHKQILRKLKIIETELAVQREVLSQHTSGSSQHQPHRLPELPFDLPMTSEDALIAVEDFLKTEANQDILIRHLKLVGGAELDLAVRGILRRCMTNGLASTFTYNGLRGEKRNFKSLILKKVVFTLRFFAFGDYQISLGDMQKVSQPACCKAINEVATMLAELAATYIYLPQTDQERKKVCDDFENRCGIPNVLGALDCTLMKIASP
ncbi:hypothetical protein JTE90_013374 [Oedothorax gibbosus]|uniref:DUF4806 domain-containing protein n=1 Tax=Oedothorax gibbosus TaxID=931172 RepID=A0AAV6TVP5_9ARAC|nr:hypothetical protein JTE90_013374 [Oedothorax gibbosus]